MSSPAVRNIRYNSGSEKPCDAGTSRAAPNPHSLLGGTRMSDPKDTIPYGFCHCGCGQKTNLARTTDPKKGWIRHQPIKYVFGHNARKSPVEYIVNHETGCWIWQRNVDRNGYGRMRVGDRLQSAHRVFYSRARGPIPEGLHLDHLCRNRNCVNPDHLEPVTNSENSHRGNRSKLNWESVADIRALAGTMTNAEIGRKLGISRPTVSEVVRRKTWVDEPGS